MHGADDSDLLRTPFLKRLGELEGVPRIPKKANEEWEPRGGMGEKVEMKLLRKAFKILNKIIKRGDASPFNRPVDPILDDCEDYFSRIESPMEYHKIRENGKIGKYISVIDLVRDIRLVVRNCHQYNGLSHDFSVAASKHLEMLENKMKEYEDRLYRKHSIKSMEKVVKICARANVRKWQKN